MARHVHHLSARRVASLTKPGYHADGAGLYLQVTASGAKSWIFRYSRDKRAREMGLGSAATISLAEGRERAQACRRQLLNGVDPLAHRQAARQEAALAAAAVMNFQTCAEAYVTAHQAGWRNAKHAAQWTATLQTYAYPVLGALPVQGVDTDLVMRVLEPIWQDKTETASRLRGRIEAVLDWAAVRGYRQGDNPARWRGHLDHLLPSRAKVRRVVHHAALPYNQVGSFMQALRAQSGVAAWALAFQILTAARTNEVIGATWEEFDLEKQIWVVAGARMKAGRDHRVPLSTQAMGTLAEIRGLSRSGYVFPGLRANRPLSNMALLQLLKRMARTEITAHGFRSTFRDWVAEQTTHSRDVAEMALAHAVGDKVEAAYRRGDLFAKRRHLMQDWADYCLGQLVADSSASQVAAA